jgi:glycosyltransferase involved in cell wall biosynthesis
MYLPVCIVLKNDPPKADLYHSVATGYSGLWGSMAKYLHHAPLLISEHGIYTREREEEIIKADWVKGIYKDIWIQQFAKFSYCAYGYADKVTSLFETARQLQVEIGCPPEKTMVTPNGIKPARFEHLEGKAPEDTFINVGSVLRVTPIKDVKTMIHAYYYAKQSEPRLKLWIMGPLDEQPEYAQECMDMVKMLNLKDVEFTGPINVTDYLGKMDIFLLTSISEGQPLSILEAFAAKVPCVATNVGNCAGLIHGERDDFGEAGIVAPVMSISGLSEGILTLAKDEDLRKQMGMNGYRRAVEFYNDEDCMETYRKLYQTLEKKR